MSYKVKANIVRKVDIPISAFYFYEYKRLRKIVRQN